MDKVDLPKIAGTPSGHHAPEPFRFDGKLATGTLAIVDTPDGERMRLVLERQENALAAQVVIDRGVSGLETLPLVGSSASDMMESEAAPQEPHSFKAVLRLTAHGDQENLPFEMSEPAGHAH